MLMLIPFAYMFHVVLSAQFPINYTGYVYVVVPTLILFLLPAYYIHLLDVKYVLLSVPTLYIRMNLLSLGRKYQRVSSSFQICFCDPRPRFLLLYIVSMISKKLSMHLFHSPYSLLFCFVFFFLYSLFNLL